MDEDTGRVPDEDQAIGWRARRIRTRRGLSLDAVAGLAGISRPHLSRLETGKRGFIRRGLLENLAQALGCSVADLTGQPYLFPDRQSASAASCLPALAVAVHDATLDDVPDVPARPLAVLVDAAREANLHADHVRYALAGHGLVELLTELQVHAVGGDADTHVEEARSLAEHLGERNHMRYHFGPSNVAAWRLTIAVETRYGPGGGRTPYGIPDRPVGVRQQGPRVHRVLRPRPGLGPGRRCARR